MGSKSRNKGHNFERLIARKLQVVWPACKRGIGQARSSGEVADVEGTPYWIECKRCKKCDPAAAMRQAQEATDGRPCVVVYKDDYAKPLVMMHLSTLIRVKEPKTWMNTEPMVTLSLESWIDWEKNST
jgi:hypothetical protein